MTQQVINEDTSQSGDSEEILVATQYQLMWWGFKKHKPAMISGAVLFIFYVLFVFRINFWHFVYNQRKNNF